MTILHRHGRWLRGHIALSLIVFVAACGDDGEGGGLATVPATFTVRPGVEQVTVTNAPAKTQLTLYDASGRALIGEITDEFGQAVFAYVPDEFMVIETGPGTQIPTNQGRTLKAGTYQIRNETVRPVEVAEFRVLDRDDVPPPSFYDAQVLDRGFGYIEMRDGVKLSATVWFPDPSLWGNQVQWPTVIEYSGYSPSNPDAQEPGSLIANLLGYAVVGVNMRGTGCSGGVFDVFNPAQQADGYDVVEVVARQPWVLHGKVGMVGLSYSGISQLFVASTRPPSLTAITPLSVIEDPWRQQWPGGVYNSGFTRQWLAERDRQAMPGGQPWVQKRIAEGDVICAENQRLRTQNVDFEQFGRVLEFYPPDADDRRLGLLVRNIEVPVYMTGAWQDEQTGSLFANMLDDFVSTDRKKFILYNGRHPDGYSPAVLTRWWEFFEFYVARRVPRLPATIRFAAPIAFEQFFGVPNLGFEPDRFPGIDDYEQALAMYEAEAPVRVLFEVGGGHEVPGAPVARFEASFATWPPPETRAQIWYLGVGGALLDEPPVSAGTDHYRHDPAAGNVTYTNASAFEFILPQIPFDWPPPAPGFALSYLSAPLAEDTVVAGNGGYVNLWFGSDAADANVEVTLTEVQPDGTEVIIQSGVLRVGHRVIDERHSDMFSVDYTFREEDFRPLAPGELIEVKIPFRPFAHPFRAGSRVRLLIDTPGRDSPLWAYDNPDYDGVVYHRVSYSPQAPSFMLLPVVDGIGVPEGYPGCPSLRGQICRQYVALQNEPANGSKSKHR